MTAATVDIYTFTDADYAQAFREQIAVGPAAYYDFTGCQLLLMVRVAPDDVEVFLSLTSTFTGVPASESGIDISVSIDDGKPSTFAIVIARNDLARIPAGEYVQSLIVVTPDGLHSDIWRGAFINQIGPTR